MLAVRVDGKLKIDKFVQIGERFAVSCFYRKIRMLSFVRHKSFAKFRGMHVSH